MCGAFFLQKCMIAGMHSKLQSIVKRWYCLTASPGAAKRQWTTPYWLDMDGIRDIACHRCPKFNENRQLCGVSFGTPLRKCVIASIEAHLHDSRHLNVLELGFGRFTLARNLIRRSGGTWTGIEPRLPRNQRPRIGHAGYGHAGEIPFENASFDRVFAIQSFEHWGQKAYTAIKPLDYADCLREICRVLKPDGTLYLDAPIHFHGHEMFIMGDLPKIRALFDPGEWTDVIMERWRFNHQPLEAYPPSAKVLEEWPLEITSYNDEEVERIRRDASVWLLTISATKSGG